ncbi:pyridoxamine 5'-phosphate oxidase family protein [Bordetella sp. BOR01]|uniref:pyridoxamine 5'-phosphate oxidase family protein n=1 Tax=Bordetella sp. BOR01 TaxID=2854779 RepID=UPI001C44A734|nr:pyridoxamine 5'-phosphate oxidase family protein [Bordetella sp. BOR01]MBV7482937.1 pyridoxamine 5'-phosphate oxidase family protein [Bordetella sp. BOR01]
MDGVIHTVEALEAQVGTRPDAVNLKVIDHLDVHAQRWLAASPLAFAGFSDAHQVAATLVGGAPGFASAPEPGQLRVPRAALDDPQHAQAGRGAGLLFLIPGLGETLRINGVVADTSTADILINVQECYAHCAKALLRSDFWRPDPGADPQDAAAFLQACRFMALATADAALHTDLSPKGDPAGSLVQAYGDGIRYADRPGNRRTDSLRNILQRPDAAALLIVPGCTRVAAAQGRAQISADPAQRRAFMVQDKTPKLVTSLAAPVLVLRESAALARSRPWLSPVPPADIDPAEIFAAHVRLNKTRGLGAAISRAMVSIPGLMRKGLQQDYKRNMY